MKTSGYSGTPLTKKLGIKENFRIRLINAPENYYELLEPLPENLELIEDVTCCKDFIHYFTKQTSELEKDIPNLKREIKPEGMIWISWPKRAAKIQTDISEDIIRNIALKNGLVDIKVCAVDEVWSALKLVIPVKDRKGKIYNLSTSF